MAPFLLIHLWNEQADQGGRRAPILYFIGVSLGTFLVINLPFLVWDARGWVLAVFEHTYAAFNVTSQGLGAVSQYGLLSLPRSFFTFLQLSLLGLMITVHWRHSRWVGMSFWIFPAIFFWAFYRSLANYWLYWIPPLLVALSATTGAKTMPSNPPGAGGKQCTFIGRHACCEPAAGRLVPEPPTGHHGQHKLSAAIW